MVIPTDYEKRIMVDQKKSDQTVSVPDWHYTNELCELSPEKADEVVARSLKLYVSTSWCKYYKIITSVAGYNMWQFKGFDYIK